MTASIIPARYDKIGSATFDRGVPLDVVMPGPPRPEDAMNALVTLGLPFTADDVRTISPYADPLEMGELFRAMAREGKIKRVGSFRSGMRSRKGGRSSIWVRANRVRGF